MGPAETYWGPDGMMHTLNWAVSDLWNCNLCVDYYVKSEQDGSGAAGTMTWETLYSFNERPEISVSLQSYSTWDDFEYTLTLQECGADNTSGTYTLHSAELPFYNETIPIPNPHPTCNPAGGVTIDSVSATPEGALVIEQTIDYYPNYPCDKYVMVNTLNNDDYYSTVISSNISEQEHDSIPSSYEALIWENFPILINSTVSVTGNGTNIETWTDQYSFWPDCIYSVQAPDISAVIKNGTNITNNLLNITTTNSGDISDFCPGFTGSVTLFHNS